MGPSELQHYADQRAQYGKASHTSEGPERPGEQRKCIRVGEKTPARRLHGFQCPEEGHVLGGAALPNHPNFAQPVVVINHPLFGKLTSVASGENSGNRTGQVAARLDF